MAKLPVVSSLVETASQPITDTISNYFNSRAEVEKCKAQERVLKHESDNQRKVKNHLIDTLADLHKHTNDARQQRHIVDSMRELAPSKTNNFGNEKVVYDAET